MSINHCAIFWALGISILLLFATKSLSAANLERRLDPEMGCVVEVSGSITIGDTDALRAMFQNDPVQISEVEQVYGLSGGHGYSNNLVRICFDSPGGSFQEAIEMALFIRNEGFGTAVSAQARCESACAIAFMAGSSFIFTEQTNVVNRAIHQSARLGFHAPSLLIPLGNYSSTEVNTAYNASLETVLELMNVFGSSMESRFPFGWLLNTPSDEMRYVESIGEAIFLGIEVVGVPFPRVFSVNSLQRACATFAANSFFIANGSPSAEGFGAEYTWSSLSDLEEVQDWLFQGPQRANPWNLRRSHLDVFAAQMPTPMLFVSEAGDRMYVSIPMSYRFSGYRGNPDASCLIRTSSRGGDIQFSATLVGEYRSGYVRDIATYFYNPQTLLSELALAQEGDGGSSYEEWLTQADRAIQVMIESRGVFD